MKKRLFRRLILLLPLAILGLFSTGFAQINSVNNGFWFSTTTWDCACIPASTDQIIVNHVVTLSFFDWIIDAPGSIIVAAGATLKEAVGAKIIYMTGGNFTNNGTTNISYLISVDASTTITNNDSMRMDVALYNVGTVINNGVMADVDTIANYGTFINTVAGRVRATLFYSEDSCVNNGNILARDFGNVGVFENNKLMRNVNLLNTGYFENMPGGISNAVFFGNLGYFENYNSAELNITFDFYNGDTVLSDAFFWNDGFVGVGRHWFNFSGDTIDGDSGQFCVAEYTVNQGTMLGTFDLCDNTPIGVTPPIIDINADSIAPGITYCASACKMVLSLTIDSTSCSGSCDGKIVARVFGGSFPYTFLWDNGGATDSILNLCEGAYLVTISDSAGDTLQAGAYLFTPALNLTMSSTNALCGDTNGTATVLAYEGNKPYTYQWNDSGNQTTVTATGLLPGLYNVTVSDVLGCTAFGDITVGQPTDLTISVIITNTTCPDSANGSIEAIVTGGTPPFTYGWEPGFGSGAIYDSIMPGSYTITVTDSNGCIVSATAELNSLNGEECSTWHIFTGISANGDLVDDTWIITGMERFDQVSVVIFSNRGIVVWESERYQNDWDGTDKGGQPLMEGIYYYVVTRPDEKFKGWIYLTR
ncbi:MAG: hypothetical protein COB85_00420 [Bacteroidetes bacterium]|nr:MAG: hypothetical protein COB85_00420 [Bacteroidota bacterium]